jgi:hypothetical protein
MAEGEKRLQVDGPPPRGAAQDVGSVVMARLGRHGPSALRLRGVNP